MEENIISAVRYKGKIKWYRSPFEYWNLNYSKLINDHRLAGIDFPIMPAGFRGGILDLTEENTAQFLKEIEGFEVSKDELSFELATRFKTADTYWDVIDIFPAIFVDFDRKHFDSIFDRSVSLHTYVPSNWTSSYEAFLYKYPDEIFPTFDKFWIKGGSDLFKIIVERTA